MHHMVYSVCALAFVVGICAFVGICLRAFVDFLPSRKTQKNVMKLTKGEGAGSGDR